MLASITSAASQFYDGVVYLY